MNDEERREVRLALDSLERGHVYDARQRLEALLELSFFRDAGVPAGLLRRDL